ncbi:HD domain-containing protein [Antarcticibacterium arcticum]|uniref:HD domain-containing protein n=1 Tax=Antarcticibacterium arcticum TaxID=2585771 RepID=UPI00196A49C7|nr:HD domain-containing protein [Antarcticibacterium arcticum]
MKFREFAREGHKDQFKKYKNEPYIEHPIRVAALVKTVAQSREMLCAAYLHDGVEDTPVTLDDIRERFGVKVAGLVRN